MMSYIFTSAWLWVVLLTLTPTLELRASIPYATLIAEWSPVRACLVAILVNTALAPLVWVFVDKGLHLLLRIDLLKRLYERYATRRRDDLQAYVDRWGSLGLALFIGIPLPGTGVYSGCVAAYLIGMRFRDTMVASLLGCIFAGVIVTLVVASGSEALRFVYKGV